MRHYIGLIHKDPDSDFGISFPDFPGCISAGDTLQKTLEGGQEALTGHIECMLEDGEVIPEPSDIDAIMADPENRDGVAVLVSIPELEERVVRINVTLPASLISRIDATTKNRSRFLAKAAERALKQG